MQPARAHAFANTIVRRHAARELVLTVPLAEDLGRRGDARPKVHRFRSQWVELGRRLRAFRARYGLTQSEVAGVLGAGTGSTVTQWETGARVPEGLRRERVEALVAGRLWVELRTALISGDAEADPPARWAAAYRWYRRASRERAPRETVGAVVAALLEDVRSVHSPDALRQQYRQLDGEWARGVASRQGFGDGNGAEMRRLEDAACGLRWLELAHGLRFDLRRSLVPQLSLSVFGEGAEAAGAAGGRFGDGLA